MTVSKKGIGSDLAKSDAHVISAEEYDEIPELTDAWFERANVYEGGKLVRRGRPPSENPKQSVHLRLDAEVIAHFRTGGPGWQTRLNDTLVRAVRRAKSHATKT